MAGFGSKGGSDDEEENAGDSESSGNDFPLVGGFALLEKLFLCLSQLLLQFLFSFVVVEPSCLGLGNGHGQEDEDDASGDEFAFHDMGAKKRASLHHEGR